MNTCELCGCTKEHVVECEIYSDESDISGYTEIQWRCDPDCEPENEVSE